MVLVHCDRCLCRKENGTKETVYGGDGPLCTKKRDLEQTPPGPGEEPPADTWTLNFWLLESLLTGLLCDSEAFGKTEEFRPEWLEPHCHLTEREEICITEHLAWSLHPLPLQLAYLAAREAGSCGFHST